MSKSKIAIFASGSGSNAENIVLYFKNNEHIEVSLIASNNSKAKVLERSKRLNIPSFCFTRNELYHTDLILKKLDDFDVDFVVLAGFLWLVPTNIINKYKNRIINIHPALLPKYGGKGMFGNHVHEAVKQNNEPETGITIHYVNEFYDEGDIIFQAKCQINSENETVEEIAEKVHELEYKYFPEIIEQIITH